jgi:hypothetical protein
MSYSFEIESSRLPSKCANPACEERVRVKGEHCDACLRMQVQARIRLRLQRAQQKGASA